MNTKIEQRLFNLGMQIKVQVIGGRIPEGYNPLFDSDVIGFMQTAVMVEIDYELHQRYQLDELDKEVG